MSAPTEPVLEGWLTKQGNYIRNWRPRWFVLKDGWLYYFKDPKNNSNATNYFLMAGASAQTCEKMGPTCFELLMGNGQRRFMQAQSVEERDAWIAAIKSSASGKVRASISAAAIGASLSDAPTQQKAVQRNPLAGIENLDVESFNFLKVLGKGNYGKVMLATHKSTEKQLYAVKIIKKAGLIDEESLEHVLAENRVLQALDHPFLVHLYASLQCKDRLYFVMEYVRGGEMFFHMGREKRFDEQRVCLYGAEILSALIYLHSKEIVYRDLKLENLLLDEHGHIKITDFGLCKENIGKEDTTSTFCGTPEYLAPEVLEDETYGKSVDWWAFGVVLYEMMSGRPPFGPSDKMERLFHNILHQQITFPSFLSQEATSLLSKLLERDVNLRLGCGPTGGEEIKQHPFFASVDWAKLEARQIPAPFVPILKGDQDTGNFDSEFTDLPAVLTPAEKGHVATATGLNNFSYVAEAPLAEDDESGAGLGM